MREGWVCPKCTRCLSPDVLECPNCGPDGSEKCVRPNEPEKPHAPLKTSAPYWWPWSDIPQYTYQHWWTHSMNCDGPSELELAEKMREAKL